MTDLSALLGIKYNCGMKFSGLSIPELFLIMYVILAMFLAVK